MLWGASCTIALSACWAQRCWPLTVLHVQMSHFYTVDTLLVFFVLLTLLLALRLLERRTLGRGVLVGLAFGLALATKVSAAPLVVPVALAWLWEAEIRLQRAGVRRARQSCRAPLRRRGGVDGPRPCWGWRSPASSRC